MNLVQEMINQLDSFETVDDIANFFREKEIKGRVQFGESCVISNWFLSEPIVRDCFTTESKITIESSFNTWEMEPNNTVASFIDNFDNWKYPELVGVNDWDKDPSDNEEVDQF